jgi:hypothetical protein
MHPFILVLLSGRTLLLVGVGLLADYHFSLLPVVLVLLLRTNLCQLIRII